MPIMLVSSPKGGSGVSTTVARLALATDKPCTIVDLQGDQLALFGTAPLAGGSTTVEVINRADRPSITVSSYPDGLSSSSLANLLKRYAPEHPVYIDAGDRPVHTMNPRHLSTLLRAHSITFVHLWVMRPCFLACRAASRLAPPDGMIVIQEPGRALTTRDLERVVGVPAHAELTFDPGIQRAVDAGLLAAPQIFNTPLQYVARSFINGNLT
jgi:hypothetical protein